MDDNYNQQPREKSFWSSVGDFFLNALIIIGSIVSVVGIATIFSNTVSNQIDDWTKDKDGKGGWGSWLRQKAGVSTEQETSATDKLSQMKDKLANKSKEYFNKGKKLFGSDAPAENQGAATPANNSPSNNPPANDQPSANDNKSNFGVIDSAAAGAGLAYLGKKAYNKMSSRVHVDKDGNIHSVTADQVKVENAVAQATKDIEEARRIQKEAQLKADSLKAPKIMEDEANNKKRWYQRGNKTANTEYNNALKSLEKANSSVTNLTTVIEEGNKVIATGQPSNNSRLRAYMEKFFSGNASAGAASAGGTEFDNIEASRKWPQSPVKQKQLGVIELPDGPVPQTSSSANIKPTTTVSGVGEYGDIVTNTKPTVAGAVASSVEPTTIQKPTIDIERSTETGRIIANDTSAPKTQAQQGTSDEAIKPKAVGEKPLQAGAPTTVKGRVGKAAGSLGLIAGAIATIRGDFENAKEHWNHKDDKGQPDSRGAAVLQGVGTTVEAVGFIAIPWTGGVSAAIGTASKEAISMGHEYVTGKPGGITQSLISSVVEATGTEVRALAKDVYNSTGFGEEAKEKTKAELKRQHDKAVEEAMLKLSPEHKAAVDAWLNKARETGRNDIDPLILIEQVKGENLRLPVQNTPNTLAKNETQVGGK